MDISLNLTQVMTGSKHTRRERNRKSGMQLLIFSFAPTFVYAWQRGHNAFVKKFQTQRFPELHKAFLNVKTMVNVIDGF